MKHITGFLLCFLPLVSIAQQQNEAAGTAIDKKITRDASFPGGLAEWKKYIERSMANISIDSSWDGVTTVLTVSFIIEKDGTVSNVSVTNERKHPQSLVKETIRIIQNSPKWMPAVKNGKVVKAYFKQPVVWHPSYEE